MTVIWYTILITRCSYFMDDPPLNGAQLLSLVHEAHRSIMDCELMFEGYSERVDGTDDGFGEKVQGILAFRVRDGAVYLDVYRRPTSPKALFTHVTAALLNTEIRKRERWPDQGVIDPRPAVTRGTVGVFNEDHIPLSFILYWLFERFSDPSSGGFENQGWELVDGRRCLRVQFDEVPGAPRTPNRSVIRMWLDIERQAHPLKVQYWRQGKLVGQTEKIRLQQVALPNGEIVWFPVYAESYNGDPETSKTVSKTVCYVINDTLRVNQDLPDSRFAIDWKGTTKASEAFAKVQREFDERAKRQPTVSHPTGRRDPRGVSEALDEQLALATAQSKELEASAPAREILGPTQYAMIICACVGTGILVAAIVIMRRSRIR